PRLHSEGSAESLANEIHRLLPLVAVGQMNDERRAHALDVHRSHLLLAELAQQVLAVALEIVLLGLCEIDLVEEMGPTLEVETELDRLLPRPPERRLLDEGGQEQQESCQQHADEQQPAVLHRSCHDLSRSLSLASAAMPSIRCTAARSTCTRTPCAISTLSTFSPSVITRPNIPLTTT